MAVVYMAGINEIRRVNVLKILKELKDSCGIDRAKFADIAGINYNLLNQYLSDNAKKNIGGKTATTITAPLGVDSEWLDQIRNELEIKLLINKKFGTTNCDAQIQYTRQEDVVTPIKFDSSRFKILPILKTIYLFRGKSVEITDNDVIKFNVEVSTNLIKPIAYEIIGSGYNKPYINGFIIICDGSIYPNGGDDTIIQTIDNRYYLGEFMYDKDAEIEMMTIDGIRETIQKVEIKEISTVMAYYTSRQKIPV